MPPPDVSYGDSSEQFDNWADKMKKAMTLKVNRPDQAQMWESYEKAMMYKDIMTEQIDTTWPSRKTSSGYKLPKPPRPPL